MPFSFSPHILKTPARLVALLIGALVVAFAAPPQARATGMSCGELGAKGLFADTEVIATTLFAADAKSGLPAYCDVRATISPVQGSEIGVVYRLPADWNGKILGLGGGGWMGNTSLNGFSGASEGLKRGYATLQTDGGHASGPVFDTSWALTASGQPNQVKLADFSYRAVHEMTVIGKEVVDKYYGKPQRRAYFEGCSTGGRQAMMETQRYPDDYVGVIAGSSVYSLTTQTDPIVRRNDFADPASRLTDQQITLIHSSVMAACDAKDGLKDGILSDPRKCKWDPASLACKPGEAAGNKCLTRPQVSAVRALFAGIKAPNGAYVAYPLPRGALPAIAGLLPKASAAGPASAISGGGMAGLSQVLFGAADFDTAKFNPSTDFMAMEKRPFAREYEASNPNLSAFVGHGGKLLMWHGWNDFGPSPFSSIDYFEAAKQMTRTKDFGDHVRLFIAPGVQHCGGGNGPNQPNLLPTLEAWVEKDETPKRLMATNAKNGRSWGLCPYPALPYYKGHGKVDDPNSYTCK